MLNFYNLINNKDFKNFSVLSIGAVAANLIPVILQPFLKSLYSPEVFGYFEIYFRISSILVIFYSLRYDYLIFSAKSSGQLSRHLLFVFCLITFNFILSLLILFFISDFLLLKLNISDNFYFLIWLIPISSFLVACFHLLIFYRTKLSEFLVIAYSRLLRRLTEGITQLSLGFAGFTDLGLFLGEIIGNFFATANLRPKKLYPKRKSLRFLLRYFKKLFLKNTKYPFNKALPDFLSLFSESIIVILILREFGIIFVGYLELSFKILVIPVTIVGAAIAPLILQKASVAINKRRPVIMELKNIIIALLSISLIFLLFVTFILEPIFFVLFDEIWTPSLKFISILIYLVCLQLIISPLGELLILIDRIAIDAAWKYLKLITLSSLLLFSFDEINSLVVTYTITSSVLYLIYLVLITYFVFRHDKNLGVHKA